MMFKFILLMNGAKINPCCAKALHNKGSHVENHQFLNKLFYLVMNIFATTPLSPSVLVPSKSGRKVSSIASRELHPSATSLAAASVSLVDIVHEISCFP